MIQVIWYKRDFRVHDHAPLTLATSSRPILAIYVYEPAIISAADFAAQQLGFIIESRSSCKLGNEYSLPIVKNEEAARTAKIRIAAVRKKVEVKNESARVFQKHGSRKRSNSRSGGSAAAASVIQLQLDL